MPLTTTIIRQTIGRPLAVLSVVVALVLSVPVAFALGVATDPESGNDVCDNSTKAPGDGTQNPDGSCVSTVIGEIPGKNKMPSTVILFPQGDDRLLVGDRLRENTPFTIRVKTVNLKTGFFSDPVTKYHVFPETLDENGSIQGHSGVVIQKIEDENEPLDPEIFAFFKGLNDPADGNGELTAMVEAGLPAGRYRLCTMVSSFAHQPVVMPVEQRGAQDDCVRFTVRQRLLG